MRSGSARPPGWSIRRPTCSRSPAGTATRAGGDRRPDGPHRPVRRAAALLFRGRHPDAARRAPPRCMTSSTCWRTASWRSSPAAGDQVPPGARRRSRGAARRPRRRIRWRSAAGADRLRRRRISRRGWRPAPSRCCTTPGLFALRPRSAERLGGADLRLARHAGGGGRVRRRLAAAAAGPAHPAVGARRVVPARGRRRGRRAGLGPAGAHHPAHRPARPDGASSGCCRTARAASAGVAGARLSSASSWGLPSTRCWRRARCRRCGSTPTPTAAAAGLEHLGSRAGRRRARTRDDAADAVFEAEVIEAQQVDWRAGKHGMSGWGGGYVTDITYMPGYYRQQSPSMIALACLLGGVAVADAAAATIR